MRTLSPKRENRTDYKRWLSINFSYNLFHILRINHRSNVLCLSYIAKRRQFERELFLDVLAAWPTLSYRSGVPAGIDPIIAGVNKPYSSDLRKILVVCKLFPTATISTWDVDLSPARPEG